MLQPGIEPLTVQKLTFYANALTTTPQFLACKCGLIVGIFSACK